MFVLPWHGQVLLGTTDVAARADEPLRATAREVDEILAVVGSYLAHAPTRQDVLAAFAGVRPLVGAAAGDTAGVSREYALSIAPSGLINLYGGKWTTFRRMARACVDTALKHHGRSAGPCVTAQEVLPARASLLPRALDPEPPTGIDTTPLVPWQPWSWDDVGHGIAQELACTVEDVLARRTRLLFTSVAAAHTVAPAVARALAAQAGHDAGWIARELAAFAAAADGYGPSDP
jgi:glycerol-3-phosphate dehydrogenase